MSFQPQQPGGLPGHGSRTGRSGLIVGIGLAVIAVVVVATGALAALDEHTVAGTATPSTAAESGQRSGAGSDARATRRLAQRFAAALSADSAAPLILISCEQPSRVEVEAFNAEAVKYSHIFTVTEPPTVRGDVATGKMRGRVKELTFTLHKRTLGWCAEFQWSGLVR